MNKVSVLGSMHGFMLSNPDYSVSSFYGALKKFKPDVILTEVRAEHANAIEGAIDGGIEQALVYAFGEKSGVSIIAVDWFDDELISQMEREDALPIPEFAQKQIEDVNQQLMKFASEGSILQVNAPELQVAIAQNYDLYEHYGLNASRKRNDKIVENIASALAKFHGKRVLVVFGLEHKFFLDNALARMLGQEVVSVASWCSSECVDLKMPDDLKLSYIGNLRAARV